MQCGEARFHDAVAVRVAESVIVGQEREGCGIEILGFGELARLAVLQIHAEGFETPRHVGGVEHEIVFRNRMLERGRENARVGRVGEANDGKFSGGVGVAGKGGREIAAFPTEFGGEQTS